MLNVAVALITPEAEVGKAQNNWVVFMLGTMRVNHVRFNVARTSYCTAVRFQTNPIFAFVIAVNARVVDTFVCEVLGGPDIFRNAVGTVSFGTDCVESSFNLHLILIIG